MGNKRQLISSKIAMLLIRELEAGTVTSAGELFTKDAVIIAPAGELSVHVFLTTFYEENARVCAEVHNIFSQALHGDCCAIHLTLEEHKKIGITVVFNCIAIIESNNGLIQKLTINFDTYPIRQKWPELFV